MSRHDFLRVLAKHEIANLAASVNSVKRLHCVRIPKANVTICGASARRQQTTLMWTPTNCFYSCSMITELGLGLVRMQWPEKEFIVVTPRGQLLIVETPLKTAHFLLVANHLAEIRIGSSEVSLEYRLISATCANSWHVPSDWAHPPKVPSNTSNEFAVYSVPYLSHSFMCSNSQMVTTLAPAHWSDRIVVADLA